MLRNAEVCQALDTMQQRCVASRFDGILVEDYREFTINCHYCVHFLIFVCVCVGGGGGGWYNELAAANSLFTISSSIYKRTNIVHQINKVMRSVSFENNVNQPYVPRAVQFYKMIFPSNLEMPHNRTKAPFNRSGNQTAPDCKDAA